VHCVEPCCYPCHNATSHCLFRNNQLDSVMCCQTTHVRQGDMRSWGFLEANLTSSMQ
jgi:hypothetical protein